MMVARVVGVALAVGFLALSGIINWRYGTRLGRDAVDQWIFSAMSLCADIAKSSTPFFFFAAVAQKQRCIAAIAALFWFACTSYSLVTIGGFMEANRATAIGAHDTTRTAHETVKAEFDRKRSERDAIGAITPPSVASARVAQLKRDRRWESSKKCDEMRGASERKLCGEISAAELDEARSLAAEKLDRELRALTRELSLGFASARSENADPRVSFVMRLFTSDARIAETVLVVLFLSVVEIGSGLGLFIALGQQGHKEAARARTASRTPSAMASSAVASQDEAGRGGTPPEAAGQLCDQQAKAVTKFARASLIAAPGASITVDALFAGYVRWCEEARTVAQDARSFALQFADLADAVGFERSGEVGYKNISLKHQA